MCNSECKLSSWEKCDSRVTVTFKISQKSILFYAIANYTHMCVDMGYIAKSFADNIN